MAGRISLGVLVAFLLAGLGYAAGRFEKHDAMLASRLLALLERGRQTSQHFPGSKHPSLC